MKATKAPEKIYLTTFGFPLCEPIPQESSNPDTVWSKKPYTGADSIEYTRTDAFIEKACKWLKESITNNPECNRIISKNSVITMGLLIEDFKNYMKGE